MIYFKVFLLLIKFSTKACFHFTNPFRETQSKAILFAVMKSCDFETAAMNLAACAGSETVIASFSIDSVTAVRKYMKYLDSLRCKLSFGGS